MANKTPPRFYRSVVARTEEDAEMMARAQAGRAGWTNLRVRSIGSDPRPDRITFHVVLDGDWPRRGDGEA